MKEFLKDVKAIMYISLVDLAAGLPQWYSIEMITILAMNIGR